MMPMTYGYAFAVVLFGLLSGVLCFLKSDSYLDNKHRFVYNDPILHLWRIKCTILAKST